MACRVWWSKAPGSLVPAYGVPSRFEKNVVRTLSNPNGEPRTQHAGTPHQLINGTFTPNGLHFTIVDAGIPDIDPDKHRLVIHGLVKRPSQGARIYVEKCLACHGENGKGGISAGLVGGAPITGVDSQKTIANFWPYATTVFDYIRRAMPWQQPRSLTNDEVYALTAYILALNKLTGENDEMNAKTLPKIKMPNRDGFIIRFPDKL